MGSTFIFSSNLWTTSERLSVSFVYIGELMSTQKHTKSWDCILSLWTVFERLYCSLKFYWTRTTYMYVAWERQAGVGGGEEGKTYPEKECSFEDILYKNSTIEVINNASTLYCWLWLQIVSYFWPWILLTLHYGRKPLLRLHLSRWIMTGISRCINRQSCSRLYSFTTMKSLHGARSSFIRTWKRAYPWKCYLDLRTKFFG